jgi:hypothetical protein
MVLDTQDRLLGYIGLWQSTCAALHIHTLRGFCTKANA